MACFLKFGGIHPVKPFNVGSQIMGIPFWGEQSSLPMQYLVGNI